MHLSIFSLFSLFSLTKLSPLTPPNNNQHSPSHAHAHSAYQTLQTTYYTPSNGLYATTNWWNAANSLTTIGSLAELSPPSSVFRQEVGDVLWNSFVKAGESGVGVRVRKEVLEGGGGIVSLDYEEGGDVEQRIMGRGGGEEYERVMVKEGGLERREKGYLNDFYDDEAWWALAWIQAYDLTKKPEYLQVAMTICDDIKLGATTPSGGIWWNKQKTYINAITNSLYLSVLSHLASRASNSSQRNSYLVSALAQLDWFLNSTMINNNWTINDGLTTTTCTSNNGTVWSYNQGVFVSAVVELSLATGDEKLLSLAARVAEAAMMRLSDEEGILYDVCEPRCGADGGQFKGIFVRGLRKLWDAGGGGDVGQYILQNAESVWERDRNTTSGQLGLIWSGPLVSVDASTHSSGLDSLVAAVGVDSG